MNVVKYPLKIILHKSGDMILYSQLDMVSVLERALRRSKLPVFFTMGFNPRIKMSFHNGLKLGVEGDIEITFYFNDPVTLDQLKQSLGPQLPEGLSITK
jgi:radical SAM-linked protein